VCCKVFYQQSKLSNGATIISEHMDGLRSVALGFWFRVGSRDELNEQSGISHFLEHMMFKGTEKRTALDISTAFDSIGAELNAFTSKEYTCYYARTLDEHLDTAIEILSDMVQNSIFSDDAIVSESEVVIEEIARSEDAPDDYVYELFTNSIFPEHQLGLPIIGTREIVGGFNRDTCLNYHKQNYHAGNLHIVACGNVNHQELHELCEQHLSNLSCMELNQRGEVIAGKRQMLNFLTKDTEQIHLVWGMPGIPLGDDDRYAMTILEAALGGPMSSRLFQEVREKRGLAYAVFASTAAFMNAAQFSVYVGTRPANLAETLQIINSEISKILEYGLYPDELKRIRDFLLGNMLLGMEATLNRMIRLGRNATNGLQIHSLEETIERYKAVSLDDILRVAKRVLNADASIAVVGPISEDELKNVISQANVSR
jgi:predicted Zn-dependent peptidase